MSIKEAKLDDIAQIQIVRNSVKENTLSNSALVTDDDCAEFISVRGKGWIYEINGKIVGFAIVDLKDNNVWALFVHPDFEKRGIGRQLHDKMITWYFTETKQRIWLSTAFNTRAESFYRRAGWIENGRHGEFEIKFEMTYSYWTDKMGYK